MVPRVLRSLGLVSVGIALVLTGPSCSKKKKGIGKLCKNQSDCKSGLKCVNRRCAAFSPNAPVCKWSLSCLKKLATKTKDENRVYQVSEWYKKLAKAPFKSACQEIPVRVAGLYNNEPYFWKPLCGAPPVPGVKRITDKSNPFRINDKEIKAGAVGSDEKSKAIHEKHLAFPDLCKAWVSFTLRRPFQGWVIAKVYEQYDCDPEQYKKRQRDPTLKPKCKTRPYSRDDRRYINLHDAGAKFELNFYFSTPPEVCHKPNLAEKKYPNGCFCLGINEEKLDLEWIDDPFLYLDQMMGKKKRR